MVKWFINVVNKYFSKIYIDSNYINIMASKEEIIDVLKTCNDPEIGIDVWTLGLIYELKSNGAIFIKMTFTTPLCPYGPMIVEEIKSKLSKFNLNVDIEVVFEPLWQPSDELRQSLGF